MDIDLFLLFEALRKETQKIDQQALSIHYTKQGWIKLDKGDISYLMNHQKIIHVLERNKVSLSDRQMAYTVLAKHIANQHHVGLGKKLYPEVLTCDGDLIE